MAITPRTIITKIQRVQIRTLKESECIYFLFMLTSRYSGVYRVQPTDCLLYRRIHICVIIIDDLYNRMR